jgi:hypothetical protein
VDTPIRASSLDAKASGPDNDCTIFGVFAEGPRTTEDIRQMTRDTLKTRIGNADYEVDTDAVAEAIVRRVLAFRRELRQAARALEGTDPFGHGHRLGAG